MKKNIFAILLILTLFLNMSMSFAITETAHKKYSKNTKYSKTKKPVQTTKTTTKVSQPKIEIALVFDSNSEKTNEIIKKYEPIIEQSLLPDYKAIFSPDLIFKGNWDEASSNNAAKQALASRAKMIICFGYWSGEYLKEHNKTKNAITVDEFAIRGFSDKFFNPLQQSVNDFVVFKNIVPDMGKTAIIMNERIYKTKNNWEEIAKKGFKEKNCNVDFVIIPVGDNIQEALNKIPKDVNSAYITQVYNLSTEQKKVMYDYFIEKKISTFSSMGKEDVELGAMFGTSAKDLDKKLAQSISFNIKNVLKGGVVKNTPLMFVDENVLFFNKDTALQIGYIPHVRLLKSVEVISNMKPQLHDLTYMFDTFEKRNLSVQRKKYLISAARRSLTAAYLNYLPTARIDLGYQTYNHEYAYSYDNVPTHASAFVFGIDQMLYAPDLVTNIIIKHKSVKFNKAEKVLTEQNMELELAKLYIDFLMLKNKLMVQRRYVDDIKDVLAIAKIRKLTGKCGAEEVLRFSGEVSKAEKDLLIATSDFENVKIAINKLLYVNQAEDFDLAPLKVTDKAFFLSDINLLDYIRTPDKMEKFISMTIEEAIYLSPETTKLKAAIAMKKAEMANYAQKFVLPNAKLTWEFSHQFGRELPYYDYLSGNIPGVSGMKQLRYAMGDGKTDVLEPNSQRLMIAAEWKPIEGGTKIAQIARCKSELNELRAHLEEVNTLIEMDIRSVINRAIAKYLCIERTYKSLSAEEENFKLVKGRYMTANTSISQMIDAVNSVHIAREEALNSQYEFYKELVSLQRGLVSVNWSIATPEAKGFIEKLKKELVPQADINVNL